MKIIFRNLASATTESQLKDLFVSFGAVQYCNLVLDKETGRSKGFGFVEMPKASEAKIAIKSLNNKKIDGVSIRVKRAEPKQHSVVNADE